MSAGLPWIDFDLAQSLAHRMIPPGPAATRAQRSECVADLRQAAARSPELVSRATGLPMVTGGFDLVVDRRSWVSSMVQTARRLWDRLDGPVEPASLAARLSGRGTASAMAGGLAVLGTRILGQFDPFAPTPRLLLVAPNVMHVERQLRLVPGDFRQWVSLHEQTHRVQFAAAPWLPEHLLGLVGEVMAAEDEAGESVADVLTRVSRRERPSESNGALLDVVSAPQARVALDRATAVMSLLEGHADVVMDLAGPEVVATLPVIRAKFERRRDQGGNWELVSKALGMDAKLAQYRDGAAFCRVVLDQVGHPGLNRVFERAEHLPTRAELAEPAQWLVRMG